MSLLTSPGEAFSPLCRAHTFPLCVPGSTYPYDTDSKYYPYRQKSLNWAKRWEVYVQHMYVAVQGHRRGMRPPSPTDETGRAGPGRLSLPRRPFLSRSGSCERFPAVGGARAACRRPPGPEPRPWRPAAALPGPNRGPGGAPGLPEAGQGGARPRRRQGPLWAAALTAAGPRWRERRSGPPARCFPLLSAPVGRPRPSRPLSTLGARLLVRGGEGGGIGAGRS